METTVAPQPLVETHGLSKRFGSHIALDGVDLRIPGGVAFGLLGPNGAGTSPSPAFAQLTERERAVLLLVARGQSNSEISIELHISETTVKTHVNHILTKLGLRDRIQAVVMAYDYGLVEPGGPRS